MHEPLSTEIRIDSESCKYSYALNEGANSRYLLDIGKNLARILDALAARARQSQSGRKAIQDGGSLLRQDPSENVVEWDQDELRVDNLCGPSSCASRTVVYFELVAQAHFTPPSFVSVFDNLNPRISLSLLSKTLVCPTTCIALICTQFPRFRLSIVLPTFAASQYTPSSLPGMIRFN